MEQNNPNKISHWQIYHYLRSLMPSSYSHLATMIMALSYQEAEINIPAPLLNNYIGGLVWYLNQMDGYDIQLQRETILACESVKRVYKQKNKQNKIPWAEIPKVLSYSDTEVLK